MEEITGILKNAVRCGSDNRYCVVGNLYQDSKNRWWDGGEIITSQVVKEEGNVIYTLNSVYKVEWA